MTGKVLLDENKQFQFDFSNAPYVWQVQELTKSTMLSDVDFITEIKGEIVFLEYKNANIQGAKAPDAMVKKMKHEDFYKKIARKFYDSLLLFWACGGNQEEKPITYVLLIEHPIIDKKIRKQLVLKIGKQLPLSLVDDRLKRKILSSFAVYNIDEWREQFSQIEIKSVVENI